MRSIAAVLALLLLAALAGLLHDVGMRELDYERLYGNTTPSPDDRVRFQKHPVINVP